MLDQGWIRVDNLWNLLSRQKWYRNRKRFAKMSGNSKTEIACVQCSSALVDLKPRHQYTVSIAWGCVSAFGTFRFQVGNISWPCFLQMSEHLWILAELSFVRKHIKKDPMYASEEVDWWRSGSLPGEISAYNKRRNTEHWTMKWTRHWLKGPMFSSYGRRPGVNSGPSITTSQPSRYITTYGPQRRWIRLSGCILFASDA